MPQSRKEVLMKQTFCGLAFRANSPGWASSSRAAQYHSIEQQNKQQRLPPNPQEVATAMLEAQ